jgi:hypothetical protein
MSSSYLRTTSLVTGFGRKLDLPRTTMEIVMALSFLSLHSGHPWASGPLPGPLAMHPEEFKPARWAACKAQLPRSPAQPNASLSISTYPPPHPCCVCLACILVV